MGYPMTYRRVVNRNGLTAGDYGTKLSGVNTKMHEQLVAEKFDPDVSIEDVLRNSLRFVSDEVERMNGRWSMLCGDLRRLELDTTDESVVCQEIARKVGVDPETVAAVLKEWMAT